MCVFIVVCFVARYFMSILVLQSYGWGIEMVALLGSSSCCLMIVVWLFLAVQWVCLRFLIVVFSDHNQLLFLKNSNTKHLNVCLWQF